MRRRVSELETDKATSDHRMPGDMKRAADEARRVVADSERLSADGIGEPDPRQIIHSALPPQR
jgi:hypothetical protein